MTVRRIAVCADDFGLHAGVDEAVLELAGRGRVTAASCMVGGPSWSRGSAALRDAAAAAQLDAGLHLDLTEFPADATLRRPLREWMLRAFTGRVDWHAIGNEIRLQLDRFEQAVGQPPAYVDGHEHVHQFPMVRDALVEALLERYATAPARPWLRCTRRAGDAGFKAWVIEQTGARGLAELSRRHGFAQNHALLGVYDFAGGPGRYRSLLLDWVGRAHDGDLVMCHPASTVGANDPIANARVDEFSVLRESGLEELFGQQGVKVMRMSRILAERATSDGR
jgi:chitin disaccharide deacetylase